MPRTAGPQVGPRCRTLLAVYNDASQFALVLPRGTALTSDSPIVRIVAATLPRKGWRRNQLAVNIAAGLVFFGFTLVMPFLPLYVAELGVKGVGKSAPSGRV